MIKAVFTDIEGTITRFAFVKYVLHPYAKEYLADFIDFYQDNPEVKEQLDAIRWSITDKNISIDRIAEILIQYLDNEERVPALQVILGMLWKSAYDQGDLISHAYQDAYNFLSKVYKNKQELNAFSSNLVNTRQLFFQKSEFDDIRQQFKDHIDSRIACKNDVSTYTEILKKISFKPQEILYLSKVKAELDAAKSVDIHSCHVLKNDHEGSHVHPWVYNTQDFPWALLCK